MYNQEYDSNGELSEKLSMFITIEPTSKTIVSTRNMIPK